jgi:hypothetical protein
VTGSGDSQRYKYDAGGEIVTRNGASYYKEWITGGKTGRLLRYTKHQCKWIGKGPPPKSPREIEESSDRDWDFREKLWPRNRIWLTTPWRRNPWTPSGEYCEEDCLRSMMTAVGEALAAGQKMLDESWLGTVYREPGPVDGRPVKPFNGKWPN